MLQTVLGLRARNYAVAVAADAVGSRYAADKDAGLRRMQAHGAEIVSAEMAAFEWLELVRRSRIQAGDRGREGALTAERVSFYRPRFFGFWPGMDLPKA